MSMAERRDLTVLSLMQLYVLDVYRPFVLRRRRLAYLLIPASVCSRDRLAWRKWYRRRRLLVLTQSLRIAVMSVDTSHCASVVGDKAWYVPWRSKQDVVRVRHARRAPRSREYAGLR